MPVMITVLATDEIALQPALESAWLSALPAARRAQLERWPDSGARHRSLLGSRLLREGLLRLGQPADVLRRLSYTTYGKPTIDLPVDFSLSHCAGRILCALSTRGPVGVDIEQIRELTGAEFRLYLTGQERIWAGDSPERFFSLWTRKEAVVKAACTRGLAELCSVRIDGDRATVAGRSWYTAALRVDQGYAAHIAHAHPLSAPVIEQISRETLCAGLTQCCRQPPELV